MEGVRYVPELYGECRPLANGVCIDNVDGSEVEALLLLYESKKKTAGAPPIIDNSYDEETNRLFIYYESESIAESVANFGPVLFNKKQYKANLLTNTKSFTYEGTP